MSPRTLDTANARRPALFAHFVLRASHLDESIAWYEAVVGMQVVFRGPGIAFLTYDQEHHRLALLATPVEGSAPPGAPGLDHVAYTFAGLGDLLATYRRLAAKGIAPVWSINHGPTTSLYYEDPDGNRVELQVENFATREDLLAFLATDAFAKNPIGVEFDPEKLAERYERGDPEEELLRQGAA